MSSIIDWNSGSGKSGNGTSGKGKKVNYLYLNGGKTYTVRPLKKPVEYAQYFYKHTGEQKNRFAFIPLSERENHPIKDKYPGKLPDKAGIRYSILVIDREDPDKIKVMPFPFSVKKQIASLAEEHGIDPGGKDGADFKIKVTGSGPKGTDYFVMFDGCNSLTKEELTLYNENKDDLDLQEIYKPHTLEEVEKRLFGKFDSNITKNTSGESESSDLNFDDKPDDDIPF